MGGLQRRNDALQPGAKLEGLQRFRVRRRHVFRAPCILEPGVLRPDSGVVEAGGDGMRVGNLAVLVLEQIGAVAMQNARRAAGEGSRMLPALQPVARRFHPDNADIRVVEEGVEQANGVRPAADAGDHRVRQPALGLRDLRAHLVADDALEVPHHLRIGRGTSGRADDVEGVVDIGDPVAQRLVEGVLEGARAAFDRSHLGAKQAHAEDVWRLPVDIDGPHIDRARQVEPGADRRRRHAVLPRPGLRDDPGLAHAPGEQNLAEAIVDLVRAGVVQLVALEVDLRAAQMRGQPLGEIERARPAGIVLVEPAHLLVERRIVLRLLIGGADLPDERHQRLGHIAAAIKAEMAPFVRSQAVAVGGGVGTHRVRSPGRAIAPDHTRAGREIKALPPSPERREPAPGP